MLKHVAGALVLAALSLLAYSSGPRAASPQIVMIHLQDGSSGQSNSRMAMSIDTPTVKAGRVTLQAVNESKELVHEVVVVPAPRPGTQLPYDTKHDRVIENRVHPLGEISDLKPGGHGKLTITLKPGTYVLFCNQPGHYKAGMTTMLTAEK